MASTSIEGQLDASQFRFTVLSFGRQILEEELSPSPSREANIPLDDLEADLSLMAQLLAGEDRFHHLEKKRHFTKRAAPRTLPSVTFKSDADAGILLYFVSQVKI